MSIKLTHHHAAPYLIILLISSISLYGAFIIEYIMHYPVCLLCIYQRFPYLIFISLTIISLAGGKMRDLFYLLNFIFALALAAYHIAIERGFLEMSGFCKPLVQISEHLSLQDFTNLLYSNDQLGACNRVAFSFLSLSLTEWNFLLNLLLLISFFTLRKIYAKTLLSTR